MRNDTLHWLVHSLDGSHKKLFYRQLKDRKGKDSALRLRMFEVLRKQESYNSKAFKEAVNEGCSDSRISVTKHRLYHDLIRFLADVREQRLRNQQAIYHWEEATILLEQSMYEEASEVCMKGLQLALDQEDLIMEVMLRERLRIIFKGMDREAHSDTITGNEYALETTGRKLTRYIRYTQIKDRMYDYHKRYRVLDDHGVKRGVEELMQREEILNPNLADSFPSQLRYHQIMGFYHHLYGDKEKTLMHHKMLVRLWEQKPERIARDQQFYLSALSNTLGLLGTTGRLEESPVYLQKLEEVRPAQRRERIQHFTNLELQYMLYFLNTGRLEQCAQREEQVIEGMDEYGRAINQGSRISLLFNLGVCRMMLGDMGRATYFFNSIRDLGRLHDRMDLQGLARILRLLLLYDNDAGTFGHYLRNSQRFFDKKDKLYPMEKAVYGWLEEHESLTDAKAKRTSYDKLVGLVYPFSRKEHLGAEEILMWATARRDARPMKEVYLEAIRKREEERQRG